MSGFPEKHGGKMDGKFSVSLWSLTMKFGEVDYFVHLACEMCNLYQSKD